NSAHALPDNYAGGTGERQSRAFDSRGAAGANSGQAASVSSSIKIAANVFSVLEFRLTYPGKGLAQPASAKDCYSWNTTAGREFRLAKLEAAMQNSWAARLIISTASASYRKGGVY